VWSARS